MILAWKISRREGVVRQEQNRNILVCGAENELSPILSPQFSNSQLCNRQNLPHITLAQLDCCYNHCYAESKLCVNRNDRSGRSSPDHRTPLSLSTEGRRQQEVSNQSVLILIVRQRLYFSLTRTFQSKGDQLKIRDRMDQGCDPAWDRQSRAEVSARTFC
jgi:hypothetical protein